MCFTAKARAAIFTTGCDEHIATFAIRLTNHFSSTGKHVILFLTVFNLVRTRTVVKGYERG